ncbi:carboxypeptidase family protein [Edaphobacter aggregans]|uniref:Carboxypeptidase family protein n=1 Tax=Edaphobacter aggregans TaxID=570835 RepID=A0A428MDW9_9BACT|nr:carboxypeptidase-like regulatory domain-containing protein [Edaphobacter aggregans]RSL15067.1 carboxypeptidase family protein [Edaphobacter aggregans]
MLSRRSIWFHLVVILGIVLLSSWPAMGQDKPVNRGRKYKAPPATSHIEIQVTKKSNGKPIQNAAVILNPSKDGKDEGSLEVKTDPDGKAIVDIIPTGSVVRVQIIANGFATFAEDYQIDESNREIQVSMIRPQEQVSSYVDNSGKVSTRKPGVQEPERQTPPASQTTPSTQPAKPAPNQ